MQTLTTVERAAIAAQPTLTHTPFGWMWADRPEKFYAHRRVAIDARAAWLALQFGAQPGYTRAAMIRARLSARTSQEVAQ